MKTIQGLVIGTCILVASGTAIGQDADKRAEELRRSSEQMKPPTQATPGGSSMPSASPTSPEEKRAAEARTRSEQMIPQNQSTPSSASGQPSASRPMTEAEKQAEDARRRSEQMKPQ